MKAKEYDDIFEDGAYVAGCCCDANYPEAVQQMLFRYNEPDKTYVRKYAKIWKHNKRFHYRVVDTFEECNGYAYTRADGLPSPLLDVRHKKNAGSYEVLSITKTIPVGVYKFEAENNYWPMIYFRKPKNVSREDYALAISIVKACLNSINWEVEK